MDELRTPILAAIEPLRGVKLSLATNTGDVRSFYFGEMRPDTKGVTSEYALHLYCPWRIEAAGRIIVGSADYYCRAEHNTDPAWEVGMAHGTRQQEILQTLLGGGIDQETGAIINTTGLFLVEEIAADGFGGITLSFTGGYQLVVFPSSSQGSEWRLVTTRRGIHFVVEGGDSYSIGPTESASREIGGEETRENS